MYQIPEWSSFQSYKDRCPPWIRLHRRLLDNFKYQKMSAEARALLPMLWLIAAEDENPVTGLLRIRNEEIAFRLRRPEKDIAAAISEIILNGFLVDLNQEESTSYESVTESLRNCHPETETETEAKTKTEDRGQKEKKDKRASDEKSGGKKPKSQQSQKPDDVSDQVWQDFIAHRKTKKAPVTETVISQIRRQAERAAFPLEDALAECCLRGWQGFNADWIDEKEKARRFAERTQKEQEEDRKAVMG